MDWDIKRKAEFHTAAFRVRREWWKEIRIALIRKDMDFQQWINEKLREDFPPPITDEERSAA